MKRWFPVWVSYEKIDNYSFAPATQFEKECFGYRIQNSQIMAYEEKVFDKTTAFQVAYLLLEKEAKKEQKEAQLS
ncbi:hypothetical protein WAF17_16660 [Bernardetia sp. ABR2-2B]|uniref:hypothetical protein n=1 Tax=Bernardetia sp. ABR2-2B TaxID=3127472 RepID=UPI0030CC73EF